MPNFTAPNNWINDKKINQLSWIFLLSLQKLIRNKVKVFSRDV